MAVESKKLALVRILQILEEHTDENHKISQDEICKRLSDDYGIVVERKAVGRNVALLREAGYNVVSEKKGCYLAERLFEDTELRVLIDGVLSSKYISPTQSSGLIDKLSKLGSKYFRSNVKDVRSVGDWSKTNNSGVFYNIEIVSEAIESKRQIRFVYNKFGADKQLHATKTHFASCCLMILHNQRYYLMAINERWKSVTYYRMDRITEIRLTKRPATEITDVAGYENGINIRDLAAAPYMYSDKPEQVTFIASADITDQVIDWLGYDVEIEEKGKDKIKVSAKASPRAMKYWAMQYADYVEVTSPESLRKEIYEGLLSASKKYAK